METGVISIETFSVLYSHFVVLTSTLPFSNYGEVIRTYNGVFTMFVICLKFPIFRRCLKCHDHG